MLLLFPAVQAWAGFCSAGSPEARHDFQFFAGYSPVSSTLIGTTTDRRFVMAGLQLPLLGLAQRLHRVVRRDHASGGFIGLFDVH